MSQMKEQGKTSEKKTKWSGDRKPSRKRIQNNESEGDPGSRKKNGGKDGEGARNVWKRPRRTKEQTEMNNTIAEIKNTLEGINNRITEAEEQISNLEDRMVEITAVEHNKEKRDEDSLRDLWDNIKRTNIRVTGVAEGGERKDPRKYLKR